MYSYTFIGESEDNDYAYNCLVWFAYNRGLDERECWQIIVLFD